MNTPIVNLDRLVSRIVLDVNLLRWFAVRGDMREAVLNSIALNRQRNEPGEQAILDFLERHVSTSEG